MRILHAWGALLLSVAFVGIAGAQEEQQPRGVQADPADHPGRAIFIRECASCHGAGPGDDGSPMLPGTAALAARYQGALPAELELRDDLDAAALRVFVRRGIGAMPAFRPAELTDADIEALADYIAASARRP